MRNYDFLFSDKRLYVYQKRVTRAVKVMIRPEKNCLKWYEVMFL